MHVAQNYGTFSIIPNLSLLAPNIFITTLFLNNIKVCSSPKVRDQVSKPYKRNGNIIVVLVLIFNYYSLFSLRNIGEFGGIWAKSNINIEIVVANFVFSQIAVGTI